MGCGRVSDPCRPDDEMAMVAGNVAWQGRSRQLYKRILFRCILFAIFYVDGETLLKTAIPIYVADGP